MTNFSDYSNGMADVVENAAQSLVTVLAQRPITGTVVGDGLILTVAHVLHADEVQVQTPDGRTLPASVAGRDPGSDLALLKVEGLNMPALSASAGNRVGELLLAVGRPASGVQASLGLYNRPGRGWLGSGAAPFRGVSGGALVDARGGLVGVLNAGLSRGTLMAVPAERALKVSGMLAETGRVKRGFLGIATQPVHFPDHQATDHQPTSQAPEGEERDGRGERERGQRERGEWGHGPRGRGGHDGPMHRRHEEHGRHRERGAERGPRGPWGRWDGGRGPWSGGDGPWGRGPRGAGWLGAGRMGLTIVTVEGGSPAEQAGLKVGDVLLALDGEGVRHPQELLRTVHDRAGEALTARILRGGEEQDVTLRVGER